MFDFFENLTVLETIYWASAIIGGLLFLLRLLLLLFGGSPDMDVDGGAGIEALEANAGLDGSDLSFKAFSFQGISAFFMLFGLTGLTLLSTDLHWAWVILGSLVVGGFAMWVVGMIYTNVLRLQSSGTVDLRNAIGKTGRVYLRIPEQGSGQVEVDVQGGMRIYDAVSADHSPVASGEFVIVQDMIDQRTLLVKKIQSAQDS